MTAPELETALVVEVPAAEPVVGQFRAQLDANAPLGVPAHITILVGYDHDLDEMLHAEQVIGANLPIRARASAVTLMTELAPGGQWSTYATFSFR